MMNQYEFITWVSKMYPKYFGGILACHTNASEITKVICEDVGYNGSYLIIHNYDLVTDYDYQVIIDHIEQNEENILFQEL